MRRKVVERESETWQKGSDPLLPASLRSVSQKGQTPCRTDKPNGDKGGKGGGEVAE